MKPYEPLPESVEYQGKRYRLNLSYTAVFAVSDLMKDPDLIDAVKLSGALEIFVRGRHPDDPGLLTAIYELLKDDKPHDTSGPKTLDIEQDWDYICAAFQQAYGIDLYTDKGMHYLRFRALLQAIPKDTKLSEIIGIRAAKLPKPTKYNADHIAELTRLKALYALRGDRLSLQDGLARMFKLMEARARDA